MLFNVGVNLALEVIFYDLLLDFPRNIPFVWVKPCLWALHDLGGVCTGKWTVIYK